MLVVVRICFFFFPTRPTSSGNRRVSLARDKTKTAEIYCGFVFAIAARRWTRRHADGVSLREIVMHKVDDDGAQRDSDRMTQGERTSERASKTSTSLSPRRAHHYFPFPRDTSLMRRDDCSLQTCQSCQLEKSEGLGRGGESNGKLIVYFKHNSMENN